MKQIFLLLLQLFVFASFAPAQTAVVYTCPMHPEVQSARPGKCPKCGMDLVKKTATAKTSKPAPKRAPTTTTTQTGKVVYTCPMHPEIQSAKPGKCPKCGMDLVKKATKPTKPAAPRPVNAAKKAVGTANNKAAHDEMREMMQEMKGMVEEMKTTVSELKEVAQQMKGGGMGSDEETMEEHEHDDMRTGDADTTSGESRVAYTCPMHPEVQSDKPGKCSKCVMPHLGQFPGFSCCTSGCITHV